MIFRTFLPPPNRCLAAYLSPLFCIGFKWSFPVCVSALTVKPLSPEEARIICHANRSSLGIFFSLTPQAFSGSKYNDSELPWSHLFTIFRQAPPLPLDAEMARPNTRGCTGLFFFLDLPVPKGLTTLGSLNQAFDRGQLGSPPQLISPDAGFFLAEQI